MDRSLESLQSSDLRSTRASPENTLLPFAMANVRESPIGFDSGLSERQQG